MTVLLFLLLLAPCSAFQQPSATAPPEYVVGPQDRLSVTVFDEPALTKVVTVDTDGTFDFPLIGRVKAGGETLRSIQLDITARLASNFLRNPRVSLEVEAYRSQVVYVTGNVRAPGAVSLSGNMSVMDALASAGSPTADAGSYILINRRPTGGATGDAQPERVSMAELQSGRAQHIVLRDGDTIFVPKAETFFVTGHVRNPGPYLLDGDVTVARAVSMAGGVTERGARNRIRITRLVEGKQVVLKNVRMEDRIMPGDAVEVPSRFF
jgi:polysaccharide export outer membrane protein